MKYRVYKKDIEHYRVEEKINGAWVDSGHYPKELVLYTCKFVVDKDLRKKTLDEKLDGPDAPVHAWIECMAVLTEFTMMNDIAFDNYMKTVDDGRVVFYNPFKMDCFVDRKTFESSNRECGYSKLFDADLVTIKGNLLKYKHYWGTKCSDHNVIIIEGDIAGDFKTKKMRNLKAVRTETVNTVNSDGRGWAGKRTYFDNGLILEKGKYYTPAGSGRMASFYYGTIKNPVLGDGHIVVTKDGKYFATDDSTEGKNLVYLERNLRTYS